MTNMEQPEGFNRTVIRFLERTTELGEKSISVIKLDRQASNLKSTMTQTKRYFTLFVAIAFLLVCPRVGTAQTPAANFAGWREFKSEEGGFTAKFPGPPQIQDFPFQKGPLSLIRHSHTFVRDDLGFGVEYTEFPLGFSNHELMIEGGMSGLKRTNEAAGGTLLSETTVVRGNCTGREVSFSTPSRGSDKPRFSMARFFVSGQRSYIVIFTGKEAGAALRELGQFFMDSFALTDGCVNLVGGANGPSTSPKNETVMGTVDRGTGWRLIENARLGFSVLMPGVASHQTEQVQQQPFRTVHDAYRVSVNDAAYSAEVLGPYPSRFRTSEVNFQTAIDITMYALKKNLEPRGFVLTEMRTLSLGQYPGRELALVNDKLKSRGRAQIYATPTYTYIFIATTPDQANGATDVNRFFASVRVLQK